MRNHEEVFQDYLTKVEERRKDVTSKQQNRKKIMAMAAVVLVVCVSIPMYNRYGKQLKKQDNGVAPSKEVTVTVGASEEHSPTPTPTKTPGTEPATPTNTPEVGGTEPEPTGGAQAISLSFVMSNYQRIQKTVGYTRQTIVHDENQKNRCERKYNANGQLLEEYKYENDELVTIQKNEYYDNGVKSLDSFEVVSGPHAHIYSQYFNQAGLRVREINESKEYYFETEYTLDEQGRYQEVTSQEGKDGKKRCIEKYFYETNKTTLVYYEADTGKVTGRRIWLYDDRNRLLSEKLYDENGNYQFEGCEFRYEGDNIVYYEWADGEEGYDFYYEYDDDGRLIKNYIGSGKSECFTYEYEGQQLVKMTYEDVVRKSVYLWKDGKRYEYGFDNMTNMEATYVYAVGMEPYVELDLEYMVRYGCRNVVMDQGVLIEASTKVQGTEKTQIYRNSEWDAYETMLTVNEYARPGDSESQSAFYNSTIYTYDAEGYLLQVQVVRRNKNRILKVIETTTYEWDREV